MNSLFDRIIDPVNLETAWQIVKKKGSRGGIDKDTVQSFDQNSSDQLRIIRQQLIDNTYVPEPYQSIYIPKKNNEFRKLGLPCIKDKIVQSATRLVIEPLFEKTFSNVSYGYRPGKGPVKAIHRVQNRIDAEKFDWVTIADIDNFFDTIDPEILFSRLDSFLRDEKLVAMIKLWVKIGSLNFKFHYSKYMEGVPQGCILSPLLSNFYLSSFDNFMVSKKYGLVRYADDFVILTNSETNAFQALKDARQFLEKELNLSLNKKFVVKKVQNKFEFLKIQFTGSLTSISDEKLNDICQKIEKSIVFFKGKPDSEKILQTLTGISNYYGKLVPQAILENIDEFISNAIVKRMGETLLKNSGLKMSDISIYLDNIFFLSKKYSGKKSFYAGKIYERISLEKKNKKSGVDKKVEKLIEKKRANYEALADAGRELVITKPGVFIGKTQKGISVKDAGKKIIEKPFFNLKQITILSQGVSISGNVIQYCSENKIPIDFIGFNGLPYAKFFTPVYPDPGLCMAQAKATENGIGTQLIKKIVVGKLKNQLSLIKYYNKYRKDKDSDYSDVYEHRISDIEKVIEKVEEIEELQVEKVRSIVMGYEGHASSLYWDMISRLLSDYTVFEQRTHQGANDLVNCLLNYGYGILYSRVWEAVIRAQLNPHISYLHAPRHDEPTLAYDLIEEFRQQVVDKSVFALITKGEDLKVVKGTLDDKTKSRLVEKVLERLNGKENFRGTEKRMIEIIRHQALSAAKFIKGTGKYKPYVGKW